MLITLAQARSIATSPIFAMRLPAAISYKFAKLAKTLGQEMQTLEVERLKLIDKHKGVLAEDRSKFLFEGDGEAAFEEEFKAVLATSIEIGIHFPMEVPLVDLSPNELLQLEPLFDMPEK